MTKERYEAAESAVPTGSEPAGSTSLGAEPLETATQQAAAWLALVKSGTITAAERRALADWRQAAQSHEAAYRRVEALWDSDELATALGLEWAAMETRATPATPVTARRRPAAFLRAVAAMAAVLLLAVGAANFDDLRYAVIADHTAGTGARENITLADGSRLVLNSGAAVSIDFSPDERQVTLLRGDAYFEVTPDPARPFEVTAAGAVARVVGTTFAVSIAPEGTGVAVREGRVAVRGESGGASNHLVELRAGRMVTVTGGRTGAPSSVDAEQALAWVDGRLIFENWPLARVVAALDKYHAGVVVLASERLRDFKVSGNYRVDDPLTVIRELARLAGAEVIEATDYLIFLR